MRKSETERQKTNKQTKGEEMDKQNRKKQAKQTSHTDRQTNKSTRHAERPASNPVTPAQLYPKTRLLTAENARVKPYRPSSAKKEV